MHTMHCARNLILCGNCDEPVPKAEFKDHFNSCQGRTPEPKVEEKIPKTETKATAARAKVESTIRKITQEKVSETILVCVLRCRMCLCRVRESIVAAVCMRGKANLTFLVITEYWFV